jgi:hypothetical protein
MRINKLWKGQRATAAKRLARMTQGGQSFP